MVSLNFLRVSIFLLSFAVADPGNFNTSVAEKQVRLTFYLATAEQCLYYFKSQVKVSCAPIGFKVRLISDLVVVIVSAACVALLSLVQDNRAYGILKSEVFTGYLLAGSLIRPGGLSFVGEMVQVETVAKFGVIFLLFALDLEFSTTKLRVVRAVAVLGGLL
ncbi:K(+) efflux antiporter 4 isoform X1 [Cucumis melo var. makuwa]|uniref:K(+) efflux antiporter 4 isoform X1 n=1 Tax=Cucumis melo var. makuwa TaxID=1194695 RepID=A0A5D3DTI3_CUCMM|nr:K(+) efflux antiporter 4 isoform X1 [Cucumis melo var. makuwa]